MERQNLLRETRRLERELRDTLTALAERDQTLLQGHDLISRSELKARKLQTALEDSEAQVSELERLKRRLNSELTEERERADRLQKDFDKLRSIQRQHQYTNFTDNNNTMNVTGSSYFSLTRQVSCSSITSKLTETTLNEL